MCHFEPRLNTIIRTSLYNHLFNNICVLTAYSVVQPISCQTLSRDLIMAFNKARDNLRIKLQHYLEDGGRISITTDTWSLRNYREFTTVTSHWIDKNWIH